MHVADVAIDISTLGTATFKYEIPDELIDVAKVGYQVEVSFRNRLTKGYLIDIYKNVDEDNLLDVIAPAKKILPILNINDTIPINEKLIELAKWISRYYGSSLADAVKLVLPPRAGKRSKKQESERNAIPDMPGNDNIILTEEQQECFNEIADAIKTERFNKIILHGVTGSGKTEIYIKAANEIIKKNQGAIILVPEIALTPQLKKSFTSVFGDRVAMIHSSLKLSERYDQWQEILSGNKNIVIGTRAALFSPVQNLKLIVIDEEHETTYKNSRSPRYHVRDIAVARAKDENAVVIFGSATPSLESIHNPQKILNLNSKYSTASTSHIEIVDLKKEFKRMPSSNSISETLKEALIENSKKNRKSIVFLNRRGFSKFIICRDCGFVPVCPKCAISLTFHLEKKILHCHHCGFYKKTKSSCERCGSHRITYKGTGTQKVEEELKSILPDVKVIRMDADTTTSRGAHAKLLKEFEKEKNAILLGTQMIAKGLHFPEVSLVGIINADTALYLPDFRSAEVTFQLLVQVAGRTGRGDETGKVILQTYNPEHYAIDYFVKGEFSKFWEEELRIRKEVGYPPFVSLINIIVSSNDVERAKDSARKLEVGLRKIEGFNADILGAVPAPIYKLRGRFRWHILLKIKEDSVEDTVAKVKGISSSIIRENVNCILDVNPQWLL